MYSLLRKPSAWVPIALSLGMLAFIFTYIMLFGVSAPQQNKDEGTPAHIFQLWLVLEAVMILFFAITWLSKEPKQALIILAIQIIAVLAACAPIFILEH